MVIKTVRKGETLNGIEPTDKVSLNWLDSLDVGAQKVLKWLGLDF